MKTRLFLTFAILAAGVAKADFSVNLDYVYATATGTPAITGPWLEAGFVNLGSGNTNCGTSGTTGCVQVTLTAEGNGTTTGIIAGEKITNVGFNLPDPSIASLTGLNFFTGTGVASSGQSFSYNAGNAIAFDGGGDYDYDVSFSPSSPLFTAGSTSVFYLSGIGAGITADNFNNLASSHGGNGAYTVAAHLQGLPGGCSVWIGNSKLSDGTTANPDLGGPGTSTDSSCGSAVPEPIHSGMFLTGGLLGFVVLARRRLFAA